jgi:hypothetical protein
MLANPVNIQTGEQLPPPKTDSEQTNYGPQDAVKISNSTPSLPQPSLQSNWVEMDPNVNNPGLADNPGRFTSQGPLLSTGKDMRKQLTGSEAPATD